MILERIDGVARGSRRRRANTASPGVLSVERSLGLFDAARRSLGAADADAGLGDLAVNDADR